MNTAPTRPPTLQNVAACVEAQVHLRPDAVAVMTDTQTVTYGALWHRVTSLSGRLQMAGLQPETNVGVLLGRTPDLIAAVLAVWHAGLTLVPIDPDDPPLRNGHILRLAQCRLLLTQPDYMEVFAGQPDLGPGLNVIDVALVPSAVEPVTAAYLSERGLAYILFTSGSTGLPKGVEIEHGSVVHLLDCVREMIASTTNDRFLATASIGFDVSFAEIFLALTSGATIVLRHRELWLRPPQLAEVIKSTGVTVCSTGPSVWALALSEVPDFPRLRIALSSGEAMTPWVAARLPHVAQAAWNLYGPTETTIWCSGKRMQIAGEPDVLLSYNNVGPPMNGMSVRVVSAEGDLCMTGETGELWFTGPLVGRGYHRQPLLTQHSFVHADGQQFYRTGDVGHLDAHGDLIYSGRNDDQMKIRGVRVEPGEIEMVLLDHPQVHSVAVTWFESEPGVRVIAAAYVASSDLPPTRADLVQWIEARLPVAMVPSRWLQLDALPKTPSNKIDHGALRTRLAQLAPSAQTRAVSNLSSIESRVAAVWQRVLRIDDIRSQDRFLELGGDSLAMVRMLAGIEQALGVRVDVRAAFMATDLREFATLVERAQLDSLTSGADRWVQLLVAAPEGPRLFFCGVDLDVALRRRWTVPASLFSVSNWATGEGFLRAPDLPGLARRQIGKIRKHQPAGPYWLAGFSFGGLLMLEIAHQLQRLGETVAMVFLLDPMPPPTSGVLEKPPVGRLRRAVEFRLTELDMKYGNNLTAALRPKDRRGTDWHYALQTAAHYTLEPYAGPTALAVADQLANLPWWNAMLTNQQAFVRLDGSHYALQSGPSLDRWMAVLADAVLKDQHV